MFKSKPLTAAEKRDKAVFEERIAPYNSLILEMGKQFGFSTSLIKAQIWTESSGFVRAERNEGKGVISRGLLGLSVGAASDMGYRGTGEGLFDPRTNLFYGLKYLRHFTDRNRGNIRAALSCYNGGYAAEKYYRETGKLINPEYVDRVFYYYRLLKT